MDTVAVAVSADDPITRDGVVARLADFPQLRVVGPGERAQVILVIAGEVTAAVLDRIRRCVPETAGGREPGLVLVANAIGREQLLAAVRLGLVGLLPRRSVGFERLVATLEAAASGGARLPDGAQRCLLDQLRGAQRSMGVTGQEPADPLSTREIRVLRLLADGVDTVGVAAQLNYSERTVKNIIHGVVTRQRLRNRTHAVAYAMRVGAF
ncbi:helix-turn-helix transcriptional regulator [Micromonospora marina]|uniref:helix-turn-helix transcriptional regulator n=1 Tax=Micromonospora marina TaxID=307120 RepID=UPI003452C148